MPRRRYEDDDDDYDDDDIDVRRSRRRDRGEQASSMVAGPAISMMVCAIFSLVIFMVACPINLIGILNKPQPIGGNNPERIGELIGGTVGIGLFMISNLIIALGAFQMKNLSNYGMAMTATILSMIPCCSPCYILGIPFGIWSLIVLLNPDVKGAFSSRR
jgi:hypothetical protein